MDFHSPTSPALLFLYQKMKLHWSDFLIHWQNVLIFQAIERSFLWLGADGCEGSVWGRTPGFEKSHGGLCMWLLLESKPMFCFLILVPSGSGKSGLLEGTLSPSVSFVIQGGGAFCSFVALGLIFPYHKNRSLGFFMRDGFRTHKATPDSWCVKWEMCQDPDYKL